MSEPEATPTPPPAPETPATPDVSPAPEPAVQTETPKRRSRAKWYVLGSVGALVLVLLLVFAYLQAPTARSDYRDPVDAESRSTNAALYAALVAAGIHDPFVDATPARAYVAYTLPNTSLAQADTYQRFVIGVAADASPNSTELYALQYMGAHPHQLWIVEMKDFLAYVRGDLTGDQFEAAIHKTVF